MAEETTPVTRAAKPRRTFDSAYGFSFSVAVGLVLFIAGLIISLTVGQGTSIGLIFGIPLLAAGLIIPMVMMRDLFVTAEIKEPCPNCGATIRTSDATLQLRCDSCQKVINVRERQLVFSVAGRRYGTGQRDGVSRSRCAGHALARRL